MNLLKARPDLVQVIFCCHKNVSNSHCWLCVWLTRPTLWNIDCLKHQTSDIRHQTQQMMRMRNVVEQMGVSESQVRRCVGARATGVECSLDWRGRRCAWAVRWRRIVDQSHNKCTKGWSRTLKITNIVLQISVHQLFGWSICPSSTFSKYKTGEYKVQSRWGGHRQWDPPTRSAPAWPGEEEEGRGFTGCTAAPPALDTPEHRKFKLLESPMRWASHCACQVNKLAIYRGRNSTHKKCWHKLAFFVARGVLAKLMMLHTNRRPHQCSVCNKAFVQKSYLTVHRWPQAAQQEPLAGVQISQLGWSDPDLCTLNTNCIYTHLCLSYCSPDKDWKSCVGHIMIMIITGIANVVTVGIVTVSHLSQLGLSLSLGMYRQNVLSLSQVEVGRVERGGALVVLQATSHTCKVLLDTSCI